MVVRKISCILTVYAVSPAAVWVFVGVCLDMQTALVSVEASSVEWVPRNEPQHLADFDQEEATMSEVERAAGTVIVSE